LEEIVVTARRRPEPLQDVPLSILAISNRNLRDAHIGKLEDLQAYVPNLTMTETGIGNHISVRGILSGENPGFEQSVGTFVDGIYHGRGQQARGSYMDLERIEILRGSQSILFGKNSIAGAQNIVSAAPTPLAEGSLSVLYEPETQQHEQIGVLSGPLNSGLRGRIAARRSTQDGHIDNLTLGRPEPQRREWNLRGRLDWDAPGDFAVKAKAEVGRFDVTGRQIEIIQETPATAGPFAGLRYADLLLAFGQDTSVANNVQDFQRSSNGDYSNNDSEDLMVSVSHAIGALEFTSITGYSSYEFDELCDCDFNGANIFRAGFQEEFDQLSQEFRFVSPPGDALSYIFGLYLDTSDLKFFDTLYVDDQSVIIPVVNALTMSTNGEFFANTGTPRFFRQDSESASIYGQTQWALSDRVQLTAALRLSRENKDASRSLTIAGIDGAPLPEPNATVAPALFAGLFNVRDHDIDGSRSESHAMPSVSIQYDFTDGRMGYVLFSRGSKSGGFDERSNNSPQDGGSFEFADEKASNFEAGVKLRFSDSAAELNAALYYTRFEDLQVSVYDGVLGYNVTNAGKAVTQGLELEGRWAISGSLILSGALALSDFEFKDYLGQCYFGQAPNAPDGRNCNYRGRSNQYVADWSGTLSADYIHVLVGGLVVHGLLSAVFTDDHLRTPTLDPAQVQDAYMKFNAKLSIGAENEQWAVAIIGRNLTDETVVPYSLDTPLSGASFGTPSVWGFIDEGRTIALQATFAF
jgi:outer membrane receptor protein involved in Fe transport